MSATRYKVIETALCIGDSVFDGEVVMVLASDYDRLEQECEQWHQLCAEAQAQRDQYQDQRDAALKQAEVMREALTKAAKGVHWLQAHVPMGKDAQWHARETRADIDVALQAKP